MGAIDDYDSTTRIFMANLYRQKSGATRKELRSDRGSWKTSRNGDKQAVLAFTFGLYPWGARAASRRCKDNGSSEQAENRAHIKITN
jgi:hypothetical protein